MSLLYNRADVAIGHTRRQMRGVGRYACSPLEAAGGAEGAEGALARRWAARA